MKTTLYILTLLLSATVGFSQKQPVNKHRPGGPGVGQAESNTSKSKTIAPDASQKQQPIDSGSVNATPADRSGMGNRDGSEGSVSTEEKDAGSNGLMEANISEREAGTTDPAPSNAPSVNQSTTSASGSPAVSSSEKNRDGTNNKQRATMNMAGSPVRGNMKLDKNNTNVDQQYVESAQMREGNIQSDSSKLNSPAYKRNQQKADVSTKRDQKASASGEKNKDQNKEKANRKRKKSKDNG